MSEQTRFEIGNQQIDGDDYFVVIEPLHWSVSLYDGPERYESDLANFTPEQRHVFACHWYLSEVNNGGHDQFYDNNTGIVWKDARDGFTAIGLSEITSIINESAQRLGGQPSLLREERQQVLESLEPDFSDLDRQLFALEEKIDVNGKLLAYMRDHRKQFYFSGLVETL